MKETKAKAEAQTDDDVDMTGPQPSQAGTAGNGRSARPTPEPRQPSRARGRTNKKLKMNDQAEEEDQVPVWATRMVPVHHSLVDAAENEVAVDSTARIIDNMIFDAHKGPISLVLFVHGHDAITILRGVRARTTA